ncbi:MAG: PEGA domain-containing protein [Acidobacteriota bacterium]
MKCASWIFLIMLVGFAPAVVGGDIQVTCEPGLRVYLDGSYVGTTTAKEDGLVLTDVAEGPHTVRVDKEGFLPISFQVNVGRTPIEIPVRAFDLELPVVSGRDRPEARTTRPVGKLQVHSVPQNCVVEIDGQARDKSTPVLEIGALDAGRHTVAFRRDGYETIAREVNLPPGAEVTVRGDLKDGRVDVVHEGKGSLRLVSRPDRCSVRLLGVTRETKNSVLNLSFLPAGEHRLVVSWKGRELERKVLIIAGQRAVVNVSFMQKDVPFSVSYEPE